MHSVGGVVGWVRTGEQAPTFLMKQLAIHDSLLCMSEAGLRCCPLVKSPFKVYKCTCVAGKWHQLYLL